MFCLIPNELQITYQAIFEKLHIIYKFNSFIITLYFATAISNAITKEFPETIKIKCFFHFLQSLVRRKYKKNNEILFNIIVLAFINLNKIKQLYDKIEEAYSDESRYGEFFKYFKKFWKPYDKKSKTKFIPIWNYYAILNKYDFDKNHLF